MKIIPFVVDCLKFFFEKNSTKLVILNRLTLPRSEKFLTKIYALYPLPKTKFSPSRFSIRNEDITLLLNLNNSIISIPLKEIRVYKNEVDFIASYDYKLRAYLFMLTDYYLKGLKGELRICPPTAGVILVSEGEKRKELINTGIGMLSLYSPDDYDTLM